MIELMMVAGGILAGVAMAYRVRRGECPLPWCNAGINHDR